MSEAIQTLPGSSSLFNDRGFLDQYVFDWHVLVEALVACLDRLDLVDDIGAVDNFAEHGVTPAIRSGGCEVQEIVVGNVDEELCRGRMRVGSTSHGQSVLVVLEAVVGFV